MMITLGFGRIRRTGRGKHFAFLVGAICVAVFANEAAAVGDNNRAADKVQTAKSKAHRARNASPTVAKKRAESSQCEAAKCRKLRAERTKLAARSGKGDERSVAIAPSTSQTRSPARRPARTTFPRRPIMLADAQGYLRPGSMLDVQASDLVVEQVAQAETPSPSSQGGQSTSTQATPKSTAPGTVQVDEASAERALERALTTTGVLLLAPGSIELESAIAYARMVRRTSTVVQDAQGNIAAREVEMRQNEFALVVRVLFGLPFDSQFEVGLPYRSVHQTMLIPEGLLDVGKERQRGSAFGDLSLGIAKTFAREHGRWPDLVGRLTWDTATGVEENNGVALGGGFNELRTSLSAVKRLDPLAIFGTLQYERAFEKHNTKPGDEIGATVGVSLAASPETALSASLQQAFARESKADGKTVTGSDRVASSLVFGASFIVSRGNLLSLSTAAGLTDDAPDYSLNLSWSLRLK
jgi:hypothetical protein